MEVAGIVEVRTGGEGDVTTRGREGGFIRGVNGGRGGD